MKKVKANQLYTYLSDLFPQASAEEWDKVGLQIKEVFNLPSQDYIRNVVICLDVTKDVVDFAIKKDSNLIISRHPFIFGELELELKNSAKKDSYQKLVENEIQVFSIHTNYDVSDHQSIVNLIESKFNVKSVEKTGDKKEIIKFNLFEEIEISKINENVKFIFGSTFSKLSRNSDLNELVKEFYICSGAGASFMVQESMKNTTFITGEAKWNEFIYSVENNINLISIGHYMENYFIDDIQTKIEKTFLDELNCYAYDIKNMWFVTQ